jgi:hypothetical protein
MEHFYQNIHGWFDYHDLYLRALNDAPTDSHFVEVGIYQGRSAAFMAVEIANGGKNIKFDCVDPWDGRTGSIGSYAGAGLQGFIDRMGPAEGYYKAITGLSPEISNQYADDSLFFVFLDGEHGYEIVQREIAAWLPKIKSGGYLAGHDFECGFEYPDGSRGRPLGDAVAEMLPGFELYKGDLATSWLYRKP